jgi:hypothetical protein
MMPQGIRGLRTREERAMPDLMLMNIHTVLRRMLDAFVSSWMRQTVAEVEQTRTCIPSGR